MSKEITIIGGGLAGLTLGIGLLKQHVPVRLLEAGRYPRHRVCGEFISGVSHTALESLGIADIFADCTRHKSSAWFYRNQQVFESTLPEEAVGISRFKLDNLLADRFAQMGGELLTETRYTQTPPVGTVMATGRPRKKASRWFGLKCHLLDFPQQSDLEMHLGRGCYFGTSAVEENRVDACGLFQLRPEIKAPRIDLLPAYLQACGLTDMADAVRANKVDEASCMGVNAFDFGWQPRPSQIAGASPTLRIGDQFAIIGPFSGNGMSMAFESAATSLTPITAYSKGDTDWLTCCLTAERMMRRQFRTRLTVSKLMHPFLTEPTPQKLLIHAGQLNLVPYNTLFRLLR